MPDTGERLDAIEQRLGAVEGGVKSLSGEVGTVRGEVQKLRVLAEANESQIKLVAEVQARHGEKLDALTKAVEPIARIEYFIETVATEHELRLRELEKRVGSSQ